MDNEVKVDSLHTVEEDNIRPPPHYHPETGPQTARHARRASWARSIADAVSD
jgi:hypothetical protein